ncbi:MAG: 2Fe-2S iron-sulfur cluster binding domain-containing protein [Sedimentisphaerales bacterium]|nr:2Fe-2S iron-sulfur cluster binding domain-containing protein [Sedimentisphaerales bacterium]
MAQEILVAVLIVSLTSAALATLLAVSERFLSDYGQCRVLLNDEKEITVQGGKTLLSVLSDNKIFIPSACGGRGTCGLCKLKVQEGAGLLLPTEEPYLNQQERDSGVRLSCQVKVRNDLKIQIPEELFNIREFTCKCAEITDLTHDIKQFRFELVEPDKIDYIPGQYIQLLTPVYEKSSEEVYRAYSVSGDPADKNHIELIIRYVPGGICTTYCFKYLKVGDEVRFNGPYGQFRLTDTDSPVVFIAGGSGMAPIKCILHHMKNNGIKRTAVYYFGAKKVKDMFMQDLMKKFQDELPDFKFIPAVSSPDPDEKWDGQKGLVTEVVKRDLKNAAQHEAYLCGSPGLVDAAEKVLVELGLTEDKIFYDKFA